MPDLRTNVTDGEVAATLHATLHNEANAKINTLVADAWTFGQELVVAGPVSAQQVLSGLPAGMTRFEIDLEYAISAGADGWSRLRVNGIETNTYVFQRMEFSSTGRAGDRSTQTAFCPSYSFQAPGGLQTAHFRGYLRNGVLHIDGQCLVHITGGMIATVIYSGKVPVTGDVTSFSFGAGAHTVENIRLRVRAA